MTASKDFFISYTSADVAWAEWIADTLERAGYQTVLQSWDFRPGSDFVSEMRGALAQAERTLAVISPAYFASEFAVSEWNAAFATDPGGGVGKLLPVRVSVFTPPALDRTRVYIDLVGLDEVQARKQLLAGVSRERLKPARPPQFPGATSTPAAYFPGRPPIIWNVPARNVTFTGRDVMLDRLHASLGQVGAAAVIQARALHGLGGVGKTQLAIEYAHRYAAEYNIIWWLVAEQPLAIASSLIALASRLGIGPRADQGEVLAALFDQLRQEDRWLIIYDNAESRKALDPYLPPAGPGQVLITSRNPAWGGRAVSVAVDVLDRADAEALLITRSGDADRIHARALAEELGDLPLALEQACAYIEQTGMSVSAYLELFRRRREELLARGEPTAYDGTVDTTWTLAFERVAHASSAAAELLRICAFLAPDAIPLDLLLKHRDILTAGLDEAIRTEMGFHDAVAELRRYSLVSRDTTGLRIHRLVQVVVRKQLTADERAAWARQALRLLEADLPGNPKEPSSFPEWAQLLPHVLSAAQIAVQERVDLAANGRLLRQAGIYLWRRIELSSAQEVLRLALAIFEDIYEPNHPEIAITLTHLGNVLRSSSDLTGARESLERARDIFETAYGPHHRRPEATVTLTSLAGVMLNLGDLIGARDNLERARDIFEAAYGPEHHHPKGRLCWAISAMSCVAWVI